MNKHRSLRLCLSEIKSRPGDARGVFEGNPGIQFEVSIPHSPFAPSHPYGLMHVVKIIERDEKDDAHLFIRAITTTAFHNEKLPRIAYVCGRVAP